jgi:hypothetical protein
MAVLGRFSGPSNCVEDQIESELELAAMGVAGLEDVVGRHLGEVGVLGQGKLGQDRSGRVR